MPELSKRLVACELAEELDGDRGRHEPGQQDPHEEEERQPDPEGREQLLHNRRLARRGDLVAHAPNRDDRRGILELAAQLAYVHVDRARIAGKGVAPHAFEQLIARQDETAMVEQLPQQIELLRRKLDLLLADVYLTPPCVDVQVAVLDRLVLALAALR